MRAGGIRTNLLVVFLVLLNVGLVLFAVKPDHAAQDPIAPQPTAAPATSSPAPANVVLAGTIHALGKPSDVLFSAADLLHSWRAQGGCGRTPVVVEYDGRRSGLHPLVAPDTYVLQLHMTGPRSGWVIGANSACQGEVFTTVNGGKSWTPSTTTPADAWVPSVSGVTASGGPTTTPCGTHPALPISLSGAGPTDAVVVCQRGIFRTTDKGQHWSPTGQVLDGRAVAVALNPKGVGFLAISQVAGCPGTRVETTRNAGKSWLPGACLSRAVGVAVATMSDRSDGLLVPPGYFFRTVNAGITWT